MKLIDKDKAIVQLSHNKHRGDEEWELAVENDIETLCNLPVIDAAPVVHGVWITQGTKDQDGNQNYHCSVCKCGEKHSPEVIVRYCWNCGARMEDADEAD